MAKTVPTIDEAAQEVQAAEHAVTELEAKIADGDTTITSSVFQKARDALDFARLREKAAAKKAEKDEVAQRQAKIDALVAEAETLTDITDLQGKFAAVVDAVGAFHSALTARAKTATELESRASRLGVWKRPRIDERVTVQSFKPADWLNAAIHEGTTGEPKSMPGYLHGSVMHDSKAGIHGLHTAERAARPMGRCPIRSSPARHGLP
ncbi:hypothetical protein Gbro_1171 [Gordonia bronchialis DSM 43247]|uniref:Uncharacterized protein n=1 Tax=Gordonia bronchialis (strain ATCC 25592 / DSM 43247 / BCRC 13721 / JCM 3198 / KCTC 3076 / NBRC 16047 / NCTC 10667) TaxID=526226 RepID=D0L527_GORB4|nr:hypothetical protein Gbro_1171 [Gordonia bronchialis DSM 43247]STQ63283.1 Uncharacterised protein [Gordonia bronchialis]STS10879.1 Uncharacterised protein [Gordonia bronchialis]